jgi:UDP-N-acetyl-D-glucosamine dehydrogenase
LRPGRHHDFALSSTPLTPENLAAADCVLVATDHEAYDYDFILEHARLIVDTRNVFGAGRNGKVYLA